MADFTFVITAHIEFPSKTQPIQTGTIRMEIPAANEAEAKEKASAFIGRKLSIVIDTCESTAVIDFKKRMAETMKGFTGNPLADAFKGWGKK